MLNSRAPLVIVALSLVALPFALDFAGLPLRSSIDVVAFAVACMGLNILVGNTGLVSFGHGFQLCAYFPRRQQCRSAGNHQRAACKSAPSIGRTVGIAVHDPDALRRRSKLVGVVRGITIYFNPSWGEASMYLLMAVVLLVRPRGLFGERIEKFE